MIAALVDGVSLTDAIIVLGIVGIILDRVADARGWSRSSKRLREENTDLLRQRDEDREKIKRHESTITQLEARVAELEKTNQAAVLASIEKHEAAAGTRHDRTIAVLTEIRDTLRAA